MSSICLQLFITTDSTKIYFFKNLPIYLPANINILNSNNNLNLGKNGAEPNDRLHIIEH